MTDDMVSWLREQIEHRFVAARAATKGGWEIGEPMPYSDPGSGISIVADGDEIAGPGHSGGGVWKQEDAAHIVFNDPRQVIADCEADLAEIARHVENFAHECEWCADHEGDFPCSYLRRQAHRYRHCPGYLAEWAPEGVTP